MTFEDCYIVTARSGQEALTLLNVKGVGYNKKDWLKSPTNIWKLEGVEPPSLVPSVIERDLIDDDVVQASDDALIKAKEPMVISAGKPKPMDYEHWKQMLGTPGKIKSVERPSEVYLCILLHDDGTFKMIVGCFYDYDKAVKYADGSPRITIVKQKVL